MFCSHDHETTGTGKLAEPFKNVFNRDLIAHMGAQLARQSSSFDSQHFTQLASDGIDALEFKQRSNHITDALSLCLPDDFKKASAILTGALCPETDAETEAETDISDPPGDPQGIRGWAILPMADYVAQKGLEDFDLGMDVLRELTKRSTAEFAVRAFLLADTDRAMKHVHHWARSPDRHVRRLASEGIRPRLPWGTRLGMFVADPSPILPILNLLKDDPEDYVRRSVANNLNDIAKDHPDLVAEIATDWLADTPSPLRSRLVRHACRTLIKKGHQPTLQALGYHPARITLNTLALDRKTVLFGQSLGVSAELQSISDGPQELIIDYVIHHRKANGQTSPKVFKWKILQLNAGEKVTITKSHTFRPITTRTYYPGTHAVEIQANGKSLGQREFELAM